MINNICNICGFGKTYQPENLESSGMFLDAGFPKERKNAKCPNCNSLERHRSVFEILKKHKLLYGKLLHIAPERCFVNAFKNFEVEHILANLTAKNPSQISIDLEKINLKDCSVDGILAIHVLEHVFNDEIALNEIFRILKPGGWALLPVPIMRKFDTIEDRKLTLKYAENPNNEKIKKELQARYGHPEHVRAYGPDFYNKLCKHFDFITIDNMFIYMGAKKRNESRYSGEQFFIARKNPKR